jgi:hypothetical protein
MQWRKYRRFTVEGRAVDQNLLYSSAQHREDIMKHGIARFRLGPHLFSVPAALALGLTTAQAADPPLELARDGFMYVGGNTMQVDGREYFYGQMYVEIKIPAHQTHPYPIIMVHGGSMSGTNYTGTLTGAKAGRNTSCATATRFTSSISPGEAAPDS